MRMDQSSGMTAEEVVNSYSAGQLARVLRYVWNPDEFRSEYGLRSLSKYHEHNPFRFGHRTVG